ncbi:heparinase II/III family protein [Segetibacter sp. 3557_3]|uniref:heparinase II/III domain-containing protein n=1 Tax=Segetibacter sp. 3557_3 TaxID=2547429 RepID=UPI001FB7B162|nr:heparinase II/III family protein [Segetibacter sp. 3557_3]
MKLILIWCLLVAGFFGNAAAQSKHPSIMLTAKNVAAVRQGIKQYPLLQSSFNDVEAAADEALRLPIEVPVPKDGGGGYTHEQHKRNYQNILACGVAYQITRDARYAAYVEDILLNYAGRYEKWPLHPKRKENHPAGRIFWQNLNDCVWQVYVIQGYDHVYDYLTPAKRKIIEEKLFSPIVKFFTVDTYDVFNRIHNHGTWSVAAVGITGYVMNRPEWAEMALRGSGKDGKTGYLMQLNQLFSPDGYYNEGPYYQRYALLPFIVFARAVQQYQPQLKIFEHRNGVLAKAIHTCLQLTYTNGSFFPFNDAIKDKTFESEELVYGVDIAYADIQAAADLLDVAKQQKRVIISDAGLKVAADIHAGKSKPFVYKPTWIKDGNEGNKGGVGILRTGPNADQQCIVFKAASQGMGHGHFDRLNFLYYDNGGEVITDYGSARFINIETKSGGDYLPENKSWAKQTIAHNTVVVDKTSHFNGNVDSGELYHPNLVYFSPRADMQIVSATEENAYSGVKLMRTMGLVTMAGFEKPLMIDVFKVSSETAHDYDLPFWYAGHITNAPLKMNTNKTRLEPLGSDNGYQHIWLNATGTATGTGSVTFLNNKRFYTNSFLADSSTRINFVTLGANDPNFNLRSEKGFILSPPKKKSHTFISLVESHGKTNPVAETTSGFTGSIRSIKMITDRDDSTVFEFEANGKTHRVSLQYGDKDKFFTLSGGR